MSLRQSTISFDRLPSKIIVSIFHYLDPFELINNVLSLRHVNKAFYKLTNNEEFYKLLFLYLRSCECYDGVYYPTHTFIDRLLLRTHREKMNEYCDESSKPVYWTVEGKLISFDDKKSPTHQTINLYEKFEGWLEAFSLEKNVLLKLLVQLCLGREMISYLGINKVGILIEMFFEQLLQPAIQMVNSWNEKPKEIEWRDSLVFNENLFQVIGTESLFGEDIASCWSEIDGITSCIPRKYMLYIAEKFRGIEVLLNDSKRTCMVTHIMKRLRMCGIKVERMRFSDVGMKMNYQRTDSMDGFIPVISKSFYLQHLAVWMNSPTLLEWCLNVGITSTTNMKYLCNNFLNLDMPLQAHVNTYIHDACGLTSLHYSIQCGNVEISKLLLNKYFANPFVKSDIKHYGTNLSPCVLAQDNKDSDSRREIYDVIEEKYGNVKIEFDTTEIVKETEQPNDSHKLNLERMCVDEGEEDSHASNANSRKDDDYIDDDEYEDGEDDKDEFDDDEDEGDYSTTRNLKEFVIVEDLNDECEETEDFDSNESENEYGLSYEWVENQIKDEQCLKRKRNPENHLLSNERTRKIRKQTEEFEMVQWNTNQIEILTDTYVDLDDNNGPLIKILKRKPHSVEDIKDDSKSDEMDENETTIESNQENLTETQKLELGPEFILRKDFTIPKCKMNSLINEIHHDYKNYSQILPNAKMLIQQVAEKKVSKNFKIAQDIAEFCGRDYVTGYDVSVAGFLLTSMKNLNNPKIERTWGRKRAIETCRNEFVEHLNIYPDQVIAQLGKLIKDETILTTLVRLISELFENTYLDESQDEEIDPNYSSDSSDSTSHSDDSMLSNVCCIYSEELNEIEVPRLDWCYSTINATSLLEERKEAIYFNNGDLFTIHEHEAYTNDNQFDLKTKLIYTTDRDKAIGWIDGLDEDIPPNEEL